MNLEWEQNLADGKGRIYIDQRWFLAFLKEYGITVEDNPIDNNIILSDGFKQVECNQGYENPMEFRAVLFKAVRDIREQWKRGNFSGVKI